MTAIWVTRSRALMATEFATMRTTVNSTVSAMERTRSLMFPIISANCSMNCCSGIALTGASLFSNMRLMASQVPGTCAG